MKKQIFSLILCVLMFLTITHVSVFAQNTAYSFEYVVWQGSTGTGYIMVEFNGEKYTLEESGQLSNIPQGADLDITIRADVGSAITSVVYNGVPRTFGEATHELNMKIDNYNDNNSLKITYEAMIYTCSIRSEGNGSAFFVTEEGKADSLTVPIGGGIEFEALAADGWQIESIIINSEEIDLEAYGKTEQNPIDRFVNGLTDIRVNTEILIVFSEKKAVVPNEEYLLGDANIDKKVNIQDATIIQKAVAGLVAFEDVQSLVADVDGDKKITVKDATAIQKFAAGIISSFPSSK